jgi:transposase-like protein
MGQRRHGSAHSTAPVRRALQHHHESLAKLAQRYDVHPKTVAEWKRCAHVHDAPKGLTSCHATVLTREEV